MKISLPSLKVDLYVDETAENTMAWIELHLGKAVTHGRTLLAYDSKGDKLYIFNYETQYKRTEIQKTSALWRSFKEILTKIPAHIDPKNNEAFADWLLYFLCLPADVTGITKYPERSSYLSTVSETLFNRTQEFLCSLKKPDPLTDLSDTIKELLPKIDSSARIFYALQTWHRCTKSTEKLQLIMQFLNGIQNLINDYLNKYCPNVTLDTAQKQWDEMMEKAQRIATLADKFHNNILSLIQKLCSDLDTPFPLLSAHACTTGADRTCSSINLGNAVKTLVNTIQQAELALTMSFKKKITEYFTGAINSLLENAKRNLLALKAAKEAFDGKPLIEELQKSAATLLGKFPANFKSDLEKIAKQKTTPIIIESFIAELEHLTKKIEMSSVCTLQRTQPVSHTSNFLYGYSRKKETPYTVQAISEIEDDLQKIREKYLALVTEQEKPAMEKAITAASEEIASAIETHKKSRAVVAGESFCRHSLSATDDPNPAIGNYQL